MKRALIVVDLQNDFCPGGSLAVTEGDQVVPLINQLIPEFDVVVYTRDWHPSNHISFSDQPRYIDKSWPVHCVAETQGAAFHPELNVIPNGFVVDKGTRMDEEAYSGFQGTNLGDCLHASSVDIVFVAGLATDYCVKATALDAIREGFRTFVISDACRGVNVPAESVGQALKELLHAGVHIIAADEVTRYA